MRLLSVLPLLLPLVSALGYDPNNNERPNNVTGLDYGYYSEIGSYYNGTFTISISPLHNPSPGVYSGDTCLEFENKTFTIELDALAAFTKLSLHTETKNPFFVDIYAWDGGFNLTNYGKTANYSEYQEDRITTREDVTGNPYISFNQTGNDTSIWYNFAGQLSDLGARTYPIKFNASGVCEENYADDLLFSVGLLTPDKRKTYDWTDDPIPFPTVQGGFNENQAWMDIAGFFWGFSDSTELVGKIRIEFDGRIDQERSDQLFMGRKRPQWNATLGLDVASVGDVDSAAVSFGPWRTTSLILGLSLLWL